MIATIVHIWVRKDHISDFITASIANQKESAKEPGNLRFDLLQDFGNPSKFVLYEAYESEEASASHKLTQHYQQWRDSVAGWMEQPREGVKHTIIAY